MKTLSSKSSVSIFILSVILSVALVTSSYADQLKPEMANTVTLADGSVVYDLNGEWDAHIDMITENMGLARISLKSPKRRINSLELN